MGYNDRRNNKIRIKSKNTNKKANETLQDVYLMIKHMGVNLEKDINQPDMREKVEEYIYELKTKIRR